MSDSRFYPIPFVVSPLVENPKPVLLPPNPIRCCRHRQQNYRKPVAGLGSRWRRLRLAIGGKSGHNATRQQSIAHLLYFVVCALGHFDGVSHLFFQHLSALHNGIGTAATV